MNIERKEVTLPVVSIVGDHAIVRGDELELGLMIEREFALYPKQGAPTGYLSLNVAARMDEHDPTSFANYTPVYEYSSTSFRPDEIEIEASGRLVAMNRKQTAVIDIRHGFTVQLPSEYVEPVRAVLATLVERMEAERMQQGRAA